jgi:hypothetical protein
MTGQLITSFLQGKVNPTTTSTIFSPYVDLVMEESKTAYFNGLHGATPDTYSPQTKTVGVRVSRALNDLLPYSLRPIKARRRRARVGYGWRMELHTFRMTWRSHRRPALVKKLQLLKELVWKR